MASSINFKAGSTFSFGCLVQLPPGTWTARAQLRKSGGSLLANLVAHLTPPVAPDTRHRLTLESGSDVTRIWQPGVVQGDVIFVDVSTPPIVIPTSNFSVTVIQGVTQ